MTLNGLEITKSCKKLIYLIFVFFFVICYFLFLELLLDELAMVLRCTKLGK